LVNTVYARALIASKNVKKNSIFLKKNEKKEDFPDFGKKNSTKKRKTICKNGGGGVKYINVEILKRHGAEMA